MKKNLLIFIITIFFISCEKDKQPIIENTDIPLISKVLIDNETYMEYSYNDANLLIEEKSKFNYSRHSYNNNNQLVASDIYWDMRIASSDSRVLEEAMNRKEWVNPGNTEKSLTRTFEYEQNEQLVRKTFTRTSSSNSEYAEFTYADGRIIRQTMFWQGVLSTYVDYDYDDRGNLVKETRYGVLPDGVAELWTTTEYEYDNKHNPYLAFRRLMTPGICTNANNITRETYTIHFEVDDFIEKVQITNKTYEYNSSGYPIKVNGGTGYVYR